MTTARGFADTGRARQEADTVTDIARGFEHGTATPIMAMKHRPAARASASAKAIKGRASICRRSAAMLPREKREATMQDVGKVLAAIGAAGFLFALFGMSTTIPDMAGGSVVNLDLQQRQLLIALGGLALLVSGAVLVSGGAMVDALRLKASAAAPDDTDAEATMERLGIKREGSDYAVRGYLYRTLPQAVAAAERR